MRSSWGKSAGRSPAGSCAAPFRWKAGAEQAGKRSPRALTAPRTWLLRAVPAPPRARAGAERAHPGGWGPPAQVAPTRRQRANPWLEGRGGGPHPTLLRNGPVRVQDAEAAVPVREVHADGHSCLLPRDLDAVCCAMLLHAGLLSWASSP